MKNDCNSAYSPLVCIGHDVPIGAGEILNCICISPSGRIAIVEPDPTRKGESYAEFISRISFYIHKMRQWDHSKLDGVAANHFYAKTGQASRIIDVMARHGYLTFADAATFPAAVDDGLQNQDILIIVSVHPDSIDMRRIEFERSPIAASGLKVALVTNEVGSHFYS